MSNLSDYIASGGGGGVEVLDYESRADLRSLNPGEGDAYLIKGLGLFIWESASTEPDDDESAFATANGVWLLEAVHWDVVSAWQAPDDAARDEFNEDFPIRFADSFAESFPDSFADSFAANILTGSATCPITSISSTSGVSFTGTVTGASVGDRVVATPPAELGSSSTYTGRLSYHAWVSAANTVTVMMTNPSTSTATTNSAIRTEWPITVIKG